MPVRQNTFLTAKAQRARRKLIIHEGRISRFKYLGFLFKKLGVLRVFAVQGLFFSRLIGEIRGKEGLISLFLKSKRDKLNAYPVLADNELRTTFRFRVPSWEPPAG